MHLPTVLLTLSTTFALAAADSYFCRPAQDKSGFLQKTYCCTTFLDIPGNEVGKLSEGCKFFSPFFASGVSYIVLLLLENLLGYSLVAGADEGIQLKQVRRWGMTLESSVTTEIRRSAVIPLWVFFSLSGVHFNASLPIIRHSSFAATASF